MRSSTSSPTPPGSEPPSERELALTDDETVSASDPEPDPRAAGHGAYWPVLAPAGAIVLAFVALAALMPARFNAFLKGINTAVVNGIGWYYVLLVAGFVVFSLYCGLSRYGDVTLGRDDEEPQYGVMSWFAMLFAAGMGIGLVFWGVAEPLNHLANPAPGEVTMDVDAAAAAQDAMATTFLHWGLHAWAIYVVVGLAVAYAVHRKGYPVSIRWALAPVFGQRMRGRLGDVVDVVAVVGTLFGVATSLGFGVVQLATGLTDIGIIGEAGIGVILTLAAVITALALLSVVSGLDVGIKWLSNGNLILAGVLMVAVLVLGPTLFILRESVQNLGVYLSRLVELSFRTLPFRGEPGETWLGAWTTYYWGWWMSWSPFVGIFIARISRGRTVREFVLGVLLVPTLLTFIWFSILGGTAIYRQLTDGGLIGADGTVATEGALFEMLRTMPGAPIFIGLFLLLLVVFFVTSADSGSFVVAMLSAGGDPEPRVWIRVFWGVLQGAIAAVLLWVGARDGALTDGLGALQTMAILVAAPFSLVMIAMCVSIFRSLHDEHRQTLRLERAALRRELAREMAESDEYDFVRPSTGVDGTAGATAVRP
ncbi:BCCT family transporter [Mobilicoccus pelagius]|uniref:Putative BCCT family transporter n=1 Tax=Mobilicoccus pelagius NBRC 104925 TaxID=1089455 RepID=H5UT31_9MICO|nr:BCCT family transporter [Mobilicoccus pelagius]GAB48889.1 putative BCCT family transporter [Mobilicoccus pelagius NBRC 104925]